jgi:hypothetical protein
LSNQQTGKLNFDTNYITIKFTRNNHVKLYPPPSHLLMLSGETFLQKISNG